MSINNKDDYDKLAKILYPSIEASGNVYYGQTRKLTMDEILGKNELNFESHIESFKQGDQTYKSYFNWKLGPLRGSVQVDCDYIKDDPAGYLYPAVFPDEDLVYIGNEEDREDNGSEYKRSVFFAKYSIDSEYNTETNELNSAQFNSYSCNFKATFVCVCYTSGTSPINIDEYDINDKNFYVDTENNYIYIKLVRFSNTIIPDVIHYSDEDINTPLTFSSEYASARFTILQGTLSTNTDNSYNEYEYRIGNGEWNPISAIVTEEPMFSVTYETIFIPQNGSVSVRCTRRVDGFRIKFSLEVEGTIEASGNIQSLLGVDFQSIDSVSENEFWELFSGCTVLSSAPIMPATKLAAHCYDSMYSNTSLSIPPELPATELASYCYYSMFAGCELLERTPVLLAESLALQSCAYMFQDCYSLSKISCYARNLGDRGTLHWIEGIFDNDNPFLPHEGEIYVNPVAIWPSDEDGTYLPDSWINQTSGYIFNVRSYMPDLDNAFKFGGVTASGADSRVNGRGKLDNEHLFSMLDTNPLYNGGVAFDTYNKDGSFNQEIWGYKSFNSPVMFRNGIYGECASLITSNPNCNSLNIRLLGNNDVIESLEPAYSLGAKFICAVPDVSYLNSPLSQYNPCSTIELYHSSVKEDYYNNDTDGNYKACVSQVGIIASNKYSDISNSNRYIDVNTASGNDYRNIHTSAVITSASVCPVVNMSTEVVGYSETYTTSITAGETQILLQQKSDNDDFILESTIIVNANEIIPLNNSETSLGNENARFSDVYANYFHGELPSLKHTNNVLSIDEGAIVMIAMKNEKADSSTTNIFTEQSYKYRNTPITFKAVVDASTVKLIGAHGAGQTHTFMYSLNGSTPTSYTDSTVINLNSGDTVSFICNQYWSNIHSDINFDLGTSGSNYYTHFEVHGNVKVYGNLISVLDSNFLNILDSDLNTVNSQTSGPYGIFARLFWGGTPGDNYCDGLTDAKDLVFPEHGVPARCFEQMFQNCTNLAFAPNPGTRTAYKSHYTMFGGCTSLNNLIVLPAYTLYESCYENMFYNCSALAKAPIILAGALEPSCCASMFYGCVSLKIAPALFAVTLETDCYRNMFDGCTSLQYAKCNFNFDPVSDTSSVINMFRDTNATGTLWLSQSGFNNSAYFLPNDWTTKLISSESIRINAGSTIAVGDYINQDGTPHNYYYADAPFNRIEQISIVCLTSDNNIGRIGREFNNLMYDYSYKLLTSCKGEPIGTIYALAMRVE